MKRLFIAILIITVALKAKSQPNYKWHTAEWANGIAKADTQNIFHRLPADLETKISPGAWNQSINSSGEYLTFKTTARSFIIKFIVKSKKFGLPHMAATAVSGLDLYAKDYNGKLNWAPPIRYSFGDTCLYIYRNLKIASRGTVEFQLYLPLYNILQMIRIGVPGSSDFQFTHANEDQPIVAYGTSIMQGAVASRPGQAWTNVLSRSLGREVINIGLSGNGRFEGPVIDIMSQTNAKVFILDCMPNLYQKKLFPIDTVRNRLTYAVKKLQQTHPGVPIIFAEHPDGLISMDMDTESVDLYHGATMMIDTIFNEFKAAGIKNVYLITEKELNFNIDDTTDGIHPNDIGMVKYAQVYGGLIKKLINEPSGELPTQRAVEQYRDGFDWHLRHQQVINEIKAKKPEVIIFGNSIINYWGGLPKPETVKPRGEASWQRFMQPLKVQNAGFGNDRIENVLWRIYHGELDQFSGNKIIINIGTNNLAVNTDEEIVQGLAFLAEQIRLRKPDATIYVGGILPRKDQFKRLSQLNESIKIMTSAAHLKFFDFSTSFLDNGLPKRDLFLSDGLHPNEAGYSILGAQFNELLKH
ncbi:SGNH/GDSL hydrolase family protein [Pedobacter sp. WC2501]|uniref:SGNH/GDSL hydrolase family protein n=1 Tax=Pedobacter sp. WC2501 TaxID=3461400 RepID=UPI0040451CD4